MKLTVFCTHILFRTCAEQSYLGAGTILNYPLYQASLNDELCHHHVSERGFTTTVTHVELNEALLRGYVVNHLYS